MIQRRESATGTPVHRVLAAAGTARYQLTTAELWLVYRCLHEQCNPTKVHWALAGCLCGVGLSRRLRRRPVTSLQTLFLASIGALYGSEASWLLRDSNPNETFDLELRRGNYQLRRFLGAAPPPRRPTVEPFDAAVAFALVTQTRRDLAGESTAGITGSPGLQALLRRDIIPLLPRVFFHWYWSRIAAPLKDA